MASIHLRLPDHELAAIDEARGDMRRLTWIRMVLRERYATTARPESDEASSPAAEAAPPQRPSEQNRPSSERIDAMIADRRRKEREAVA